MSRITVSDARGLLEAYSSVYASQELTEEQIWKEVENWVNSLLEEGYDLSDYTWEEMYEEYLNEMGQRMTTGQATAPKVAPTPTSRPQVAGGGMDGMRGSGRDRNATQTSSSPGALRVPAAPASNPPTKPTKPPIPTRTPAPTRPVAPTPAAAKTAPTRPTTPAKPAGSAMDQWAKANPNLAAAAAEKARIRGTQQTDNPLMKDMRSRLPMNSPSVQSSSVSKLGAGNQSLVNNRNAFKAATPTQSIKAAPSTSPSASGSVAPATAAIAATPKPTPVAPRQTARERMLNQSYEYDAYDLVLEYLLSNGHVETVDEAHYVMLEMEAEVIQDIVKEVLDEDAKYDRNRRRAAQRAEARNEARRRGQTGNVPGVGYVSPRPERSTYRDESGVERHHTGARMPQKDK